MTLRRRLPAVFMLLLLLLSLQGGGGVCESGHGDPESSQHVGMDMSTSGATPASGAVHAHRESVSIPTDQSARSGDRCADDEGGACDGPMTPGSCGLMSVCGGPVALSVAALPARMDAASAPNHAEPLALQVGAGTAPSAPPPRA